MMKMIPPSVAKMKNCPFCGSNYGYLDVDRIRCGKCYASGPPNFTMAFLDEFTGWNHRADPTQRQFEELEKQIYISQCKAASLTEKLEDLIKKYIPRGTVDEVS